MATASERFWTKVDKTGTCWIWTGRSKKGYGYFADERAHRFSYRTFVGPIPDGKLVLHHCDNPPCVRPDHLFLGTQADNMADAAAKGRMVGSREARGVALLRGDGHPSTKIADADLPRIFARRAAGATQAAIAAEFGVSQGQISLILLGRRRALDDGHLLDAGVAALPGGRHRPRR